MRMRVDVRPIGTSGMVVLSEAQKRKVGPEGRIPVAVEVGGETFRTTVVRMHGDWCFVANARMRAAGLTPGRQHVLEIARDDEPRGLEPPAELAPLLVAEPGARDWDALPWYHQREVAEYITEAKSAEARQRRAEKAAREHLG